MTELIPNIEIHKLEAVRSENDEETCKTFILHHEDHTLGNSLRYMIMKNPAVEFCGYSVPHPSEEKINVRIQTKEKPAVDALKKGLTDLQKVCEHVLETFQLTVKEFKEGNDENEDDEMETDDDDEEDTEWSGEIANFTEETVHWEISKPQEFRDC